MADWDDEEFEPEAAAPAAVGVNLASDKWDGEDEDDDVKDAWDAESEEEDKDKEEKTEVKVKKKKTLAQKIAEKEEAAEAARLEKLKQEEEAKQADTPEARLAEKLRLQKLAEENDLKLAQEMFGVSSGGGGGVIDSMNPQTKEDFDSLAKAVLDKFSALDQSEHYQDFAESFVKDLCTTLTVQTLKKCKQHVESFHSAKLKEEKANAARIKKGKPAKSTLKFDNDSQVFASGGYDEMDDFM